MARNLVVDWCPIPVVVDRALRRPLTGTILPISVHSSVWKCTFLPRCSSSQAHSLEAGSNRSGDSQCWVSFIIGTVPQ